jgi:hypothetical protein
MRKVHPRFGEAGAGLSKGHPFPNPNGGDSYTLADVLLSVHSVYSNAAAVEALTSDFHDGVILVNGVPFIWVPASTANDATKQVSIRPTSIDSGDPGRFEILSRSFALNLAVTYQTADNAVLFTVPTGFRLVAERLFYRVGSSFIHPDGRVGASSSNAAYNTAGDLIGGAGGDAAAALTAGVRGGTIGAKFGSNGAVELVAGDTIKWNVIAAGYTAGAADLVVLCTRS